MHPHQEFSGVAPPPEYCHTKNIETIGNLVYASKDDRKKKERDFRKKSAKYMYVLRWCSLHYKVSIKCFRSGCVIKMNFTINRSD